MRKYDFLKIPSYFVLCLLAFFTCACSEGCIPTEKYERIVQLTAPLPTGSLFEAQTHNGDINITGSNVAECNLIATITARADTIENAQKLAEAVEVKLVPSDSKLIAKIEKPELAPDECICISFDVTVPNQTNTNLTTHNGALKIKNLTGQINGTTHNGEVTAEKIAGTVELQTHNGEITCKDAAGNIKLQTHNGNAEAFYSATAPPVCNASIITHNGNVSITTPPNLSAKIEISTHNGSIDTDLPITVTGEVTENKLTGTIGKGEGKLYLETYNGSIKIK